MKRWLLAVVIVVIIAVGVGAFFGGKASGGGTPSPTAALKVLTNLTAAQRQSLLGSGGGLAGVFGGGFGDRGAGATGAAGAGGFTTGSIVSSDSNSLTVKLSSGGSKIVLYSPSTVIAVSKTGSASDLTTGQDVTVTGTANSDGSITATRIQVGTLPRPTTRTSGGTGANGQRTGGGTATTGAGATTFLTRAYADFEREQGKRFLETPSMRAGSR